jgi:isoleucyl-tRNA synthetase
MTSERSDPPYPPLESRADYPALERRVLARWAENGTFKRSVEMRPAGEKGKNEFVFYDGPPFANGPMHYGHILTGFAKDVVPRYQTMRGRRVERRFGWDCHGLPAEMQAEKELGISGRQAIQDFGIDRFNAHCRESVLKYTEAWRDGVTRMARWVDFDDDYKTMDASYMESVMWAFKLLWDKGLVYERYRVMPYSWAAETPLSNFETRLDNSYRPRQDPAVTVALTLVPEEEDGGVPHKLLIWTTTPWTLPSNLAAAIGPDIDYAVVEQDGVRYVLGQAAVEKYAAQLERATQVETLQGRDLVGRSYEPLFPYFAAAPNAFRVLKADFVDTEEGTGIVHMAPGFGEEDQRVCEANGIETVVPVDDSGRFTDEVPDWKGVNVLEANKPIIKRLKEAGVLFKHETYVHNYPHCWRTDEPLIYKALSSWYVRVTDFRDRMVELNRRVNWIPDHIRDGQFGKWLEGARDWSISRNRFWGTPIPIWQSDDPAYPRVDCYGSIEELERDFGVEVADLHRPAIDELVRPNPDDPTGQSMMRRVPDVLDCWFESGSMPFAQVHYPFENKEWFERHFPGDFIVEYVAQTRGWFYTLMVLGTALFDCAPFRNCICHGVLLEPSGKRKLGKRYANYSSPDEVFETRGADALRWYMMSAPIMRGGDLRFDSGDTGIGDVTRLVLNPIWNAYSFFTLYANVDGYRAAFRTNAAGLLDRYVLAKTRELIDGVQVSMDAYDLAGACARVSAHVDALNNWYIRRSRQRFYGAEDTQDTQDKRDAYDTLYTVLVTLSRVAAPLLPFLADHIHTALTGEESVHLCDWPDPFAFPVDHELVARMDRVRDVCSTALALREENRLRTRLPLATLIVAGRRSAALEPFAHLVAEEVNVKRVQLSEDLEAHGHFVLQPDGRVLGPKLGSAMGDITRAARAGAWTRGEDGTVTVAGHILAEGEYALRLEPKDGAVSQALRTNDAVVVLDTTLTPELEAEGLARDLVRIVQKTRKEADLVVTDRIELALFLPASLASAVEAWQEYVAEQVLASEVRYRPPADDMVKAEAELGGEPITLGFRVSGG